MVIVEMKKHFQLRAIEWWSAAVMAGWGFWVLAFPTIFELNPAMTGLAAIMPQQVWGLVALGAGIIRLGALLINGMWYRTPTIRWSCSMLSVLIWFIMASVFFRSSVPNTGVIIYGGLMIADMYSAFRAASDFVEAEAQRKLKQLSVATADAGSSNVRSLSARQR